MPATFLFYLREDRPDKRGSCPVILRIIQNRKKKYINTGIRIKPNDWNPEKEVVRRSHSTYNKLNDELDNIREKANQAYRELNREHKASAETIKQRLEYASKDDFFELSKEYLDDLEYNNQFHVRKQSKSAFDKFRVFHGSDALPLNMVDVELLNKFQLYLKNERGNKATTIHKNFASLQSVLDKAKQRHLITENPIRSDGFKLIKKSGDPSKTKLSLQQIQAIENLDLKPGSNFWHARNAFMLSFYFCGMRFGDLAELRWKNIKNGRLQYRMSKTGNEISIPIKDGARNILDQYDKKTDYIFPFLEDLTLEQRKSPALVRKKIGSWNAYINGQDSDGKTTGLKAIAKQAGIDEDVSMHVARHSFAQYGVNDRNIAPYKMMMLLGHKSIKTTMIYLKSLDLKTVDNVMDEIF